MPTFDYDLLIIGAGSAGVRAARMAASMGKRVALVEKQRVGGTCVNVGCIPKKLFHYAAHYADSFHDARAYGWQTTMPAFDWDTLKQNTQQEITRLNGIYHKLLDNAGVDYMEGEGQVSGPHHVTMDNRVLSATTLVIATGCTPWLPTLPGIDHAITSNDFFALPALPSSMVIVGGGYIAVELACIVNSFGVNTTLVHRGESILRGFDNDVRFFLQDALQKQGINLMLHENVSRIDKSEEGCSVELVSGKQLQTGKILFATGRKPDLQGLGLENTTVKMSTQGYIEANENYQTAEPSIYALGDVLGRRELTPVATAEAMRLVDHLYGSHSKPALDYSLVASTVFSSPEVGCVGLSEQDAVAVYGDDIAIYKTDFRALRHTITESSERTLMKLVVQRSTDRVLGLHMAGSDAGEILQGFAVAINMGATKAQFDATIGIHPTAAEEFVTMRTAVARA